MCFQIIPFSSEAHNMVSRLLGDNEFLVFILLRFQIDPLWTAYSNIFVSMIVFFVSV